MSIIIVDLNDTIASWRSKTNSLSTLVGDQVALTTDVDSDIVGAINWLNTRRLADSAAASNLDSSVGNLATLTTIDKSSLVAAINENDSNIGINTINIASNDSDIAVLYAQDGTLSVLDTVAKGSLVAAINELHGEIGDRTTLVTTAQSTLVASINETYNRIVNIYDKNGTLLN